MNSFYTNIRQYGNDMLVRGWDSDGKRVHKRVKYSPYLFVDSDEENSEYTTIHGKPVSMVEFDTIKDAKEFVGRYEDVAGFNFYGMTAFTYPFIADMFPDGVPYDRSLIRVASIDIETMSDTGFPDVATANKAMTAITISDGSHFWFLSVKEYVAHMDNVTVISCSDEKEMLLKFLVIWKQIDPDIVTGWNSTRFDLAYIINRIKRILSEDHAKRMSPWGIIFDRKINEKFGSETTVYDIVGIADMDYLDLYRKFTFTTRENYKLDTIASVELGVGKVDYSEYGSLHGLYEKNFQLYAEYNIRDTEIINQLDTKTGLIDLALAIAYDARMNYVDAFTSVRMWDIIIHNYLLKNKMVVPQFKPSGATNFAGGFVKEPQVGASEWVCSFDLNSLYPHLIMQYGISPDQFRGKPFFELDVDKVLAGELKQESFREYMEQHNVAITPNGCAWSRDKQGFLSQLMETMYSDRKAYKKKMLAKLSEAEEIEKEIAEIDRMIAEMG